MSEGVIIENVEVLKSGTYVDSNGQDVTVTDADLQELAAAYDPALLENPAVVGHPKIDHPAYGWVTRYHIGCNDAGASVLLADFDQVEEQFAGLVKSGRLKHRSLAYWGRRHKGNPKPGSLYPRHVGWLGARPPAVPGLKPVALAGADDEYVELSSPRPWVFRSLAGALGKIRDYLIDKEGIEKADQVVTSWTIQDLHETAAQMEAEDAKRAPQFSQPKEVTMEPKELAEREKALADREAHLATRETALAAAEAATRAKDDQAFVDGLVKEGKLPPDTKADTLALLAALDDSVEIELAAGDDGKPAKASPREAYRRQLSARPVMVRPGEIAGKDGPNTDAVVAFAAPDGYAVDIARLQLHGKALAYQKANPGTDYLTAAKAVS